MDIMYSRRVYSHRHAVPGLKRPLEAGRIIIVMQRCHIWYATEALPKFDIATKVQFRLL